MTQLIESVPQSIYATGYGFQDDYAQYTAPIVDVPAGSDLIEDWELFYGLSQRLDLQLEITPRSGAPISLDMYRKPSQDELLELMCVGSRVPLAVVKQHPDGSTFSAATPILVAARDEGCTDRLNVAHPGMLADLGEISIAGEKSDDEYPFGCCAVARCTSSIRRTTSTRQTEGGPSTQRSLHPADLWALGLTAGDLVEIRSAAGRIPGIVERDPSLRRGTLSMAFGFGGGPDTDDRVREIGSNTTRLIGGLSERYSGQPRMSNVPVSISRFVSDLASATEADGPPW